MNELQQEMIAFAHTHDWGQEHGAVPNDDGSITVGCDCHHPITGWSVEYTRVHSMRELQEWAGY